MAETSDKPKCFIAMPITTHEQHLPLYGSDPEHFLHVLDFLFKPAILEAGFEPLSPISQGSELIHSDIIDQLQSSDMVLVDMSSLNANVFFEFGIRTSLDKPVAIIRDNKTPKIPFDAALLNAHTYEPRLDPWFLKDEIPKLAQHIRTSRERSGGQNPLWKHFGFRLKAAPATAPTNEDEKLTLILNELSGLRRVAAQEELPMSELKYIDRTSDPRAKQQDQILEAVIEAASKANVAVVEIEMN
jgi:hypothetical protein